MEPTLVAYCSYRDVPAGIGWLEAIGFVVVTRQEDAGGGVVHAELRLGDAVVMVGGDDEYVVPPLVGQSTGGGVYLVTDEVDDRFTRGVDAGGTPVIPPEDTGWGSRRARLLDPEGHEWTFGSYRPAGG